MKGFTPWWEQHLPAWIIVYCYSGEAELTLLSKTYGLRQGMTAIIAYDMYPSFASATNDFKTFYCLIETDFAEKSFYDMPYAFFEALYAEPVLYASETMNEWTGIFNAVSEKNENPYRQSILADLLHAFMLDYYEKWKRQYGNRNSKNGRTSAESICTRFYDMVFNHFKEHRSTAFYADKLCITPCYLAMATRQVCHETPKQAIDRQVTMEMKYLLKNTNMTAEQIADYLHFSDASYMCRFFRRQTGQSLSEYRKTNGIK